MTKCIGPISPEQVWQRRPRIFPPSHLLSAFKNGNERWASGIPPVLIKNARIRTGEENIEHGDVFMEKGFVAAGLLPRSLLRHIKYLDIKVEIINAHGHWLTPVLVDIHSHLGVWSVPSLGSAASMG
ncbi:hypothetical protein D9619_012910 [Psilocybe cf. subviscida]|uniref:Amidohydrolase-related domain-containing protein n=1 Tax=Psilocybe cf. subviscida TaxID=2480587 RepID=A0A8H5BIB6_9AGAR|nr:hypothetical protein D9619_012910 [Psilocybe cf. subviscida]